MQVKLSESSETVWVELTPTLGQITEGYTEQNPLVLLKSGIVSHDGYVEP